MLSFLFNQKKNTSERHRTLLVTHVTIFLSKPLEGDGLDDSKAVSRKENENENAELQALWIGLNKNCQKS